MSGAHTIEPFQNFSNTSVIWDPNLNVSSISDVLRIPFDRTFIDGRWPTSCGCNRPREVLLALWFSIANISRECLFLTSRKSAGITTTKLKSRMKPRFVKEKSSSSSSSARRTADNLDDGQQIAIGAHLQSSLSRTNSFRASPNRSKVNNASWKTRLSRVLTCHPTVPHNPQNNRAITNHDIDTFHVPLCTYPAMMNVNVSRRTATTTASRCTSYHPRLARITHTCATKVAVFRALAHTSETSAVSPDPGCADHGANRKIIATTCSTKLIRVQSLSVAIKILLSHESKRPPSSPRDGVPRTGPREFMSVPRDAMHANMSAVTPPSCPPVPFCHWSGPKTGADRKSRKTGPKKLELFKGFTG